MSVHTVPAVAELAERVLVRISTEDAGRPREAAIARGKKYTCILLLRNTATVYAYLKVRMYTYI